MKLFRHEHSNQSGFSLIEVMIGGAILTGVGMASFAIYSDRFNSLGQIEDLRELETFHRTLMKDMSDTSNCNATLKSWYDKTKVPESDVKSIFYCRTSSGTCIDSNLANAVTQDTARFTEAKANPTNNTQWIDGKRKWEITELAVTLPATRSGILNLNIIYTLNPKSKTPKKVYKVLPLSVKFTRTPFKFLTCASDREANIRTLVMDMCEGLGSSNSTTGKLVTWNDASQRCLPVTNPRPKQCNNGNSMVTGIDENGNTDCKAITFKVDTTTTLDTTDADCTMAKMPSLYVNASGKIQVRCN